MKPTVVWAALAVCGLAAAQTEPSRPAFEVASIKPADPQPAGRIMIGMTADDGVLRYSNVSLKDCIRVAYSLKDFQIEGPSWLETSRFDITAKLPAGSSKDQVPEMLQNLLAERFKLTAHREKRDHAIYAMVVGKNGPKLKPAEDPGMPPENAPAPRSLSAPPPPGADGPRSQGSGPTLSKGPGGAPPRGAMMMQMSPEGMHFRAAAATLPQLAESLSRFSERPVVDMTGITGKYDFDLLFSPETMRGMRPGGLPGPPPSGEAHPDGQDSSAGSIYDAVQQYGLKLEARKAPMEVLIVDHMEKSPTEN